jgi:hypothetical protein
MNKLEYAHKLVVESKYSPLKAVKVAEVKIEDYNEYVKGLKEPKSEIKEEEKAEIEKIKEEGLNEKGKKIIEKVIKDIEDKGLEEIVKPKTKKKKK